MNFLEFFNKIRSSKTIFIHDLLMVPIAWLGAFWLRFNLSEVPEASLDIALSYLPFIIAAQALASHFFGLYRGVWRFASMADFLRILKAVLSAILVIAILLFLYNRLEGVPRSVPLFYAGLLVFLLITPRFLYRYWKDGLGRNLDGKRALIVGAGEAGELLVRDLLRESQREYSPVFFVDDDRAKRRREIRGIRVIGSFRKIPKLVAEYNIEVILIAVPSASDSEMQRIVELCELCEVPFLTLPSVSEILSGSALKERLREVSIDDLLGREPVNLEWDRVNECLEGKTVLVTGGGGSIGSELCRQLAQISIKQLIIFENSEFNLYKIEQELQVLSPSLAILPLLGDVVDRAAVRKLMQKCKPDLVFHAAAYKHVPLLERQVRAAVRNNVLGSVNVAQEAAEVGVEKFVLISTDKAVNPTNVMGATKRIAELFCQSFGAEPRTQFITVRFGNVLGSAGSVVPLFKEQIKKGGPVTVTHPSMTRYFMTIPEASQLIMEAASVGRGSEIFVLDMGEPVKVSYLAEQLIRLSGKRVGEDIEIKYIGLRPGEKLFEELFHGDEELKPSGHDKLFFASSRAHEKNWVSQLLKQLEEACSRLDEAQILATIRELVPEYQEDKVTNSCEDESREAITRADRRKFQRTG